MTTNNNQPEDNTPTFTKYQKVWVKAEIDEQSEIDADVWCVNTKDENEDNFPFYTSKSEIRTTAQILQEHGALAPQNTQDRTRPFRERDKVRIVERDARKPDLLPGFDCGKIYEVRDDEGCHGDVCLKNPIYDNEDLYIPWFFLDLVEEAPNPRFIVIEDIENKEYKIFDREQKITVSTYLMNYHALRYINRQCDILNKFGMLVLQ